ncbi:MAG: type II toxin-antitoxin system RelE/ParE family toxin [Phycisphaerales bacterium]|nr:type II toxin-antitoxin system RelE/ParE family toxin [Phycisphaerales bacterium]
MSYDVRVLPSAERELANLPRRDRIRVLDRIDALSAQPRPVGSRKLRGLVESYSLRQGNHRIL